MAHRFVFFLLLAVSFTISMANAQNRYYHVYLDTDNQSSTGCSVNLPDFASVIEGVEQRVTITTNSALPPNVTSTEIHPCNGASFSTGTAISPAALGLNTGTNGADVFEAGFDQALLNLNSSGRVVFYFETQSDTASDVVLNHANGGPITLGFTFPVPAFGLLAIGLLLVLLLISSKRHFSRHMTMTILFIAGASTVWAMNIIIDGQTNDWSGINAANTDPIGDTSNNGSFADLTAVFVTKANETIYVRMDVVDVENQAPVADSTSDTTLEDNSVTITLTGSDAENSPITFSAGNPPPNGTLSNFNVINNTTSTVLYTPNADFNGSDSFTVVANDGQVDSAPATVTVSVDAVNDAPSFNSGGNVNVLKTAGPYNAIWATNVLAGPSDETGQNLTFNIINNDNAAIFDVQPAIDSAGVLSFTGVPDVSGTANITINLSDDGGTANGGIDTSGNLTFTINLQGVNDEPSFTVGANQSVLEDAGATSIPAWATNISAGPPDEAGQALTFNIIANDNPSLFSAGPVVAADGTLSYTPTADASGLANISIELMDDGGVANGGDDTSPPQNFSITVTAVNDAPSFTAGADESLLEGAGSQTVNGWATAISPGPTDENGQTVTFNVTNDNNALFSVQPAISSTGTLTYTPTASALGSATVSVSLSDDGGTANGGLDTSAIQTFVISITAVNDEPSFTAGPDQSVVEDNGATTIPNWATNISAGPPDEAGQNLTFNITANDNASLFSAGPAVASDGTLTYTTAADANGVANITLELMDDGGTANGGDDTSPPQNFSISVTAVNDPPIFTSGTDQTVLEESGSQVVNGWATGISPGPSDESGQSITFNVTNDNNGLFSVQPALDNSGNLTYTPAANTSGTALVSVTAVDDGGTGNGGNDTSATQTFNINVTGVNDAPSFTAGASPQLTDEDTGAQNIAWASAISAGPPDESGQTLTFILSQSSIDSTLTFDAAPSISAAGVLTYTAAANAYGTVNYDVSLMDNGGTANGGIDTSASVPLTITVNPINDAPTAVALGPYTATTNISVNYAAGSGLLNGIMDDATEAADPNGPASPGTNLTIGNGGNPAPTTTVNGGDVSINTTTGSFTYDPPPGFTGTDSFDVVVCDDGIGLPASACSPAITVEITVSGNTVWFIDNNSVAGGDGRLSSPFQTTAEFEASAEPGINDFIFYYSGVGDYDGTLNLANGQTVFGQGTTGTTFNAYTGLTPVANSTPTPSLAGSRPQLVSTAGNAINLAVNNTLRGFNVGNTSDTDLNATANVGNLTISEMSLLGNGRALNLTNGGNLNVILDQLVSNSGVNGINLTGAGGTIGGSLTVTGGTSIDSSSTNGIYILDLSAGSNYNFGNTNISNTGANGIQIYADTGSTVTYNQLNVTNPNNYAYFQYGGGLNISSGLLNAPSGVGFNFENGVANVNLDSVTAVHGNAFGIKLANNTGTINLGNGSLTTNSGGIGIEVGLAAPGSGGSAVVTYSGNIFSNHSTSRSVHVRNITGGSINLNGNINDAGLGILLNDNGAGSVNFTGQLALNTTTNPGFRAFNGGTITATGTGSSITTTSGRAIEINNVTIGGANFNVQSVTQSAGPNAILLNNTGAGSFRINGVGTTVASGGTLSGITQEAILLTDTTNAYFNGLNVSNITHEAIKGVRVNGLTVSNGSFNNVGSVDAQADDDVFGFDRLGQGDNGLFGTALFQNLSISNVHERAIDITNEGGNNLDLDIINVSVDDNDDAQGEDAIKVQSRGSINTDVLLMGGTYNNIELDVLAYFTEGTGTNAITVSGVTSTNGGGPDNFPNGGGIAIISDRGTAGFNLDNNTLTAVMGEPVQVVGLAMPNTTLTLNGTISNHNFSTDNADLVDLDFDGDISGTSIINTTIDVNGNTGSFEDDGVGVDHRDTAGTANIHVRNNVFNVIAGLDGITTDSDDGVFVFSDDDTGFAGVHRLNMIVDSNQINDVDTGDKVLVVEDIRDANRSACFNIDGNNVTTGVNTIELDFDASGGGAEVVQADATAISNNNDTATVNIIDQAPTFGSASCVTVPLP
jgi:hypothetical protein